jgi:hypothetical protein
MRCVITADGAQSHWIILYAPDLALYGSLLQAEPFLEERLAHSGVGRVLRRRR